MSNNFWLPNSNKKDKNYGSISFTVYVNMLDRYGPCPEAQKFDSCILEVHCLAGDDSKEDLVGLVEINVVILEIQANTLQNCKELEVMITGSVKFLKNVVNSNQENVLQLLPS